MTAKQGKTRTCVIRNGRWKKIQSEILVVLANDHVLRAFRDNPIAEVSIRQPWLSKVDEIVADRSRSHAGEPYSRITVVGDEALGYKHRLRVPRDQDASARI